VDLGSEVAQLVSDISNQSAKKHLIDLMQYL
jgi:hypothetical protein